MIINSIQKSVTTGSTRYSAPINAFIGNVDANGKLLGPESTTIPDLTPIREISDFQFAGRFKDSSMAGILTLGLETIGNNGCVQAFANCTNITKVVAQNLVTLGGTGILNAMGECFKGDTSLVELDLRNLVTIEEGALDSICEGCINLVTVRFDSLENIIGNAASMTNAFAGCTSLARIDFPSLVQVSYYGFKSYGSGPFPSNCTVHFPAALDPSVSTVISGAFGYSTRFGAGALVFDL